MFTKTVYHKNKQLTLAIDVIPLSEYSYQITNFYYSSDNKDFVPIGEMLKTKKCIYTVSKTFGIDNKLHFNNRIVKPVEYGTLTCFDLGKRIVIPESLIDNAIEKCKFK